MGHTSRPPRSSILHALEVPERDGEPLGNTWFASTATACDALPDDVKKRIEGRKCLYICESVISRIVGLDQEESDNRIALLERHVVRPEFVYRHRWRVGDVVTADEIPDPAQLTLRTRLNGTEIDLGPAWREACCCPSYTTSREPIRICGSRWSKAYPAP